MPLSGTASQRGPPLAFDGRMTILRRLAITAIFLAFLHAQTVAAQSPAGKLTAPRRNFPDENS